MLRNKRTKFRLRADNFNNSNFSDHHNREVAEKVEEAPEHLPAARKIPQPNLSQMIEQRTWENDQLRKELKYLQRKHGLSVYLLEEVKLVVNSLEKAIRNFEQQGTEIEQECVSRGT
jgi:hypothetical protein